MEDMLEYTDYGASIMLGFLSRDRGVIVSNWCTLQAGSPDPQALCWW